MKLFFICLFFCIIPVFSQAAVVVNEVAWMGTSVSANDEWIELYNNGSQSVDVSDWTLSDGINLNITLAGSIASGQYAVLERTDDDSAPGTRFMLYVGALSNAGVTLSLYRADNALEDRVAGGELWVDIGGDNSTKETAQYTTGGWVTAVATPGKVNFQPESVADAQEEEDTSGADDDISDTQTDKEKSDSDTSDSAGITQHLNPRTLHSNIEAPSRAYVNQVVTLNVSTTGLAESIMRSAKHTWNFGDVTTGEGEEVAHRYQYPGEYVITLHSQYKVYEAYTRQTITVLPVSFSMTTNAVGDVQVHNDAKYEVDLSGYSIGAGVKLEFPPRTILLPNATITIAKEKLKYSGNAVATLFDDTATIVAFIPATIVPPATVAAQALQQPVHAAAAAIKKPAIKQEILSENFSFKSDEKADPVTEVSQKSIATKAGVSQMAAPIEAAKDIPNTKLPYFALLAVIGLGVTAVFAGRVK